MNKENIILFDLDGTLIDSTEAILESFLYAFKKEKFNFQGTLKDINKEIGYPLDIMFQTLGVDKEVVSNFVESYKENYREISSQKTVLLPKAKESIILASSFATLGIVTTKTTQYSRILLEDMGVMKYFNVMVGRQEVINPKPHPEPVLKALEMFETKPSKDIYLIGDTKLDLISAQKANINSAAVLCGYGEFEELKKYTNNIFKDSLEAVKYIQERLENKA